MKHPMVQRLAGVDVPVEDDCIMLGDSEGLLEHDCIMLGREAEVRVISQKCMCPACRPTKAMPPETPTAETFRHYNQKLKNNFKMFKIIKNTNVKFK